MFFYAGVANRASALLCSTLSTNNLLHLKGKQKFKNQNYYHAHVLNRTVLTLQNVLKYSNQHSGSVTSHNHKNDEECSLGNLMQSEECSLEMLNDDVFYLLLQDMVQQRSKDEVQ